MMKAWVIKSKPATGKLADTLELVEDYAKIPDVNGKDDKIVVRVEYSSVAIDDIRIAENRFLPMLQISPSEEKPFVPGHECGGTVTAVGGSSSSDWKVGDKVYGCTSAGPPPGNAWAEYAVLSAKTAGRVPDTWTMAQAVASITGNSVGSAVIKNLPQDELEGKVVVVIGASSSIGSAMLQWLVGRKARVWAVCSGGKAYLVTKLGAEKVLDYTKGPWEEQIVPEGGSTEEATDSKVVDYVLDFVGGTKQEAAAVKVLKKTSSSKFITVVGPNDSTSEAIGWMGLIGLASNMLWRIVTWRNPRYVMAVQDDPHDNSTPSLGTNIVPLVDTEANGWNKDEVQNAIQRVDSRRAAGRVLLRFT